MVAFQLTGVFAVQRLVNRNLTIVTVSMRDERLCFGAKTAAFNFVTDNIDMLAPVAAAAKGIRCCCWLSD